MTDRYSYHIHSAMCRPRQRTRMNRDSLVEIKCMQINHYFIHNYTFVVIKKLSPRPTLWKLIYERLLEIRPKSLRR